jgi:hypothetical protein
VGVKVAVVAIVRGEKPFLDEWLVYHRLLGVDHFFVYDDEPDLSVGGFLKPHFPHVTVVPWFERHRNLPGRNKQTKAYTHALANGLGLFEWVMYLDVDEFLLLKRHSTIQEFLSGFDRSVSSVSLNWMVFGHNGFYEDPPGLVTSALTKRMLLPSSRCKSISRCADIVRVESAHRVVLGRGSRVGATGSAFTESQANPGDVDVACVNHYQCRSFSRWMGRFDRGFAADDPVGMYPVNDWKRSREGCLRQFVTVVAAKHNEIVDPTMLKYSLVLAGEIDRIGRRGIADDANPEGCEPGSRSRHAETK